MLGIKMPKEKKRYFTKNERLILKVVHDRRSPLTIREIAKKAGLSWVTTKKYLKILTKKGWIVEKKEKYKESEI